MQLHLRFFSQSISITRHDKFILKIKWQIAQCRKFLTDQSEGFDKTKFYATGGGIAAERLISRSLAPKLECLRPLSETRMVGRQGFD